MFSHHVSAGFSAPSQAQDRVSARLACLLLCCVSLTLWYGIAALAAHLA
jgi:hypothetical protein